MTTNIDPFHSAHHVFVNVAMCESHVSSDVIPMRSSVEFRYELESLLILREISCSESIICSESIFEMIAEPAMFCE